MTHTPTDALRLVPCPFCGGEAQETIYSGNPCIFCRGCEALMGGEEYHGTEDRLRENWNRRAAPASPLPGGGDMDWQSVAMWMGFAASVIKSGEPWSDQCQQHYDEAKAAFARLAAPTGEPK